MKCTVLVVVVVVVVAEAVGVLRFSFCSEVRDVSGFSPELLKELSEAGASRETLVPHADRRLIDLKTQVL